MTKLRLIFDVDEAPLVDSKYVIKKDVINFIAMVLSNLRNSDKEIILVTAGAIASGIERLNLHEYPHNLIEKQALAAIGQVELIKRYQNIFDEYTQMVAQVLLSRDIFYNPKQQYNAKNTFSKLLHLGIIPIINENDTISTADIEQENNYMLTATVASITNTDALIVLTKDLSFKVLCRGNDYYQTFKTKEELILFLENFENQKTKKTKYSFPIVFPEKEI